MSLDPKTVVKELKGLFEADEIDPETGDPVVEPVASLPPDAIKQKGELHPAVSKSLKKLHAIQNQIVNGDHDDYQSLHKAAMDSISLAKKHGHKDIIGDLHAIKKVALKHDAIKRKSGAPKDDMKLAAPEPHVPEAPIKPEKSAEELPSSDLEDEPEADPKKSSLGVGAASHKSVKSVDPAVKLKSNPKYDWGTKDGDKKTPPPLDRKAKAAEKDKLTSLKRAQTPAASDVDKAVDTMRNAFANDSNYKQSVSGAKYDPSHDKAAIQKSAPAAKPGDHGMVKTTTKGGFDAKVIPPGQKPKAVNPPVRPMEPDPRKMPLPKKKPPVPAPKA